MPYLLSWTCYFKQILHVRLFNAINLKRQKLFFVLPFRSKFPLVGYYLEWQNSEMRHQIIYFHYDLYTTYI